MSKVKIFTWRILTICTLLLTCSLCNLAQPAIPDAELDANLRQQPTKFNYDKSLMRCRDPWINHAIGATTGWTRGTHGIGDTGECNPMLYNGGSWGSWREFARAFTWGKIALQVAGVSWASTPLSGGGLRVALQEINSKRMLGYQDIGAVGNIIAMGGDNIIAVGGNNIIAVGGNNYRTQSADGTIKIQLYKSVITIRRKS